MCGIVGGAAAWMTDGERERVRELMLVSNLRGFQGAGMIFSDNKCENVRHLKTTGTGIDAAYSKDYREKTAGVGINSVMIGHTRWPTKGKVDLDATHPHIIDHIHGVHNGTIRDIDGVAIPAGESDSKLLYKLIAEEGVGAVIPQVNGAYCLVWIDSNQKTLNFLRNGERPLWFATINNNSCVYWASEKEMLSFVLDRHNLKYTLEELKVNTHIKIQLPIKHNMKDWEKTITELKGWAPPVREVTTYRGPFRDGFWDGWWNYDAHKETEKKDGEAAKKEEVTPSSRNLPVAHSNGVPKPRMRFSEELSDWVPKELTEDQIRTSRTKKQTSSETGSTKDKEPLKDIAQYIKETHGDDTEVVNTTPFETKESVEDLPPFIETCKNHYVSSKVVAGILEKDGCCWCTSAVALRDYKSVQWIDHSNFICDDCASDPWQVDYINNSMNADVKLIKKAA